jgi:hypothetical protein
LKAFSTKVNKIREQFFYYQNRLFFKFNYNRIS